MSSQISKDVKSGGKVIDTIKVTQFENTAEAVKSIGEEAAIALINRQYLTDAVNAARAAKTRTTSPAAQLMKLAKQNPEVQKKIDKMLAEMGEKPAS